MTHLLGRLALHGNQTGGLFVVVVVVALVVLVVLVVVVAFGPCTDPTTPGNGFTAKVF